MRRRIGIAIVAGVAALGAVEAAERSGEPRPADAVAREGAAATAPAPARATASPVPSPSPERAALLDAAPRRVQAPPGRAPRDARGLIAKVPAGTRLPVLDRPGGSVVGRAGDRTDFGSRTALTVFETRGGGRWIGVATDARPPGRLGWIRVPAGRLDWYRTDRSLHVDVSERRMELRDGRRVLRSATVGVGRPSTPTPTGRFGVTDRLLGTDFGYWYGCCIIAFTGIQPNLPPGWQGGNRIGVHGTSSAAGIGAASSAGCLRAGDDVLERLMTGLPLGAPVHIRR
ncbi:MAG: L,D-transpeptidase family protein [Thermoleophilaceae bacterium]